MSERPPPALFLWLDSQTAFTTLVCSFRDDMGGTGTWNRECKTLYVGRICATPTEAQMLETLVRHFGEFGLLETVRVIKAKGIGFITYKMRCSAEFAKEAMMEQTLDNDEQINVRMLASFVTARALEQSPSSFTRPQRRNAPPRRVIAHRRLGCAGAVGLRRPQPSSSGDPAAQPRATDARCDGEERRLSRVGGG